MSVFNLIFKAKELDTYYDFSTGLSISDNEVSSYVSQCIMKCIEKLRSNLSIDESFHTISIGNVKVFVEAYRSDKEISLNVSITNDYRRKSFNYELLS